MAENSPIEWTDHTWSPWEGCTKVSPGCDHCYAEGMNRWLRKGQNWGPGAPRRTYSEEHWMKPVRWNEQAAKAGKRIRVFPSVCDPFDNEVDEALRGDFLWLVEHTPNIDWLVLTKRIGNAARMLRDLHYAEPLPNVWLGATVVNQEEADRDIPKLLATPARVRFLSMEPLLGPVNLLPAFMPPEIDWVIVGGESGRGARPMHPDWARSLRDQCAAAGVPFLFKQHGEWHESIEANTSCWVAADGRGTIEHGTDEEAEAFLGKTGTKWRLVYRPGKKAAGRLLDGRTHDEFPEVR